MKVPKPLYRILGNFSVGLASPFVGNNLGETIFNLGFTFEQIMVVSLAGATFTTILSISKEALELGKIKWR